MYFSKTTIVSFSLLASSSLVAGHGAIIGATGDAGGQGSAIGVDPATPRDGTGRNPFQQDSTRFRGAAADSCGETLGGGDNNVESGTAQVMSLNGDTLPQITPGGEVQMTVHQVNSDGAGPYTCMIDATGTGTNWQPIQVTQNLPGNERGRNRDTETQDQPLTAAIPAGQTCTGTVAGQTNVCMVRCQNPARAGPFGGCVPVQMVQAAGANNTAETIDQNVANNNQNQAINTPQAQAPQGNVNGNVQQGQLDNTQLVNGQIPQNNQNAQLVNGNTQIPQQNGQLVNGNTQIPQQNGQLVNGNTQIPQQNAQLANGNTQLANGNGQVQNIPQGQTVPQGNFVGGGATTLARRTIAANPVLTNDDQEEEVDLLY